MNEEGEAIDGKVKQAGDLITYWITFANPSKFEKLAKVTDVLPENTEFVEDNTFGYDSYNVEAEKNVETKSELTRSYEAATHTVTWMCPVAPQCQRTVAVTVRILDSAKDTILSNKANVYFSNIEKETNEVRTPVLEDPVKMVFEASGIKESESNENASVSENTISDVSVSGNDITGLPVKAGDVITYSVTYVNPSEETKLANITDQLPEGVEYLTSTKGGSYDATTHTVTWRDIETAARKRAFVTVTVRVKKTAEDTLLENVAYVHMDEAHLPTRTKTPDSSIDNPKPGMEETVKNFVNAKHVYNEKKEDIDNKFVAMGDLITYTISYKNVTSANQTYRVTDTVDDDISIVSVTKGGEVKGQTVTWNFTVEPGVQDALTIVGQVKDGTSGKKITNVANIDTVNPVTNVPSKKDTNTVTNYVYEDVKKRVLDEKGKEINDFVVKTGDTITYDIALKNPAEDEREFTVTDVLPEGITPESADYAGVITGQTVEWKISLKKSESVVLTVKAKVNDAGKGNTQENVVKVTEKNSEVSSNPVKTYTLKEPKKTVMSGETNLDGGKVKASQEVMYSITYNNPTDKNMSITVKDVVDKTIVDSITKITDGGKLSGGTITWLIDNVKPHTDGTVSFFVKMPDVKDSVEIKNTAQVIMKDANGVKESDTNTVKLTLEKAPSGTVEKTVPKTGDPFVNLTGLMDRVGGLYAKENDKDSIKEPTSYPDNILKKNVIRTEKSVPKTGEAFYLPFISIK